MNREEKQKKTAVMRAGVTYFFKETFRAHSRAEYKEIFARGLNEDNGGVSGAFPWLYVRAFFALFILFTVNVLILRLTDNALFVPSVVFLGGITFIIPFIILLYELYPKRDLSLFMLIAVLVGGGTLASLLTQICYLVIPRQDMWLQAVVVGGVEELCKALPALIIIAVSRRQDSYACYLLAAAVGAGFSVVEDMGYIFYYSDRFAFEYHSDIQAAVALFVDRGLSSFATHILWTGAIGWGFSYIRKPLKSFRFFLIVISSFALHTLWDLPLTGVLEVIVIIICVVSAAALNITIVHKSRMRTLSQEVDLTAVNEHIIKSAKQMGERLRFTNAANLTFVLSCMLLSVFILLFASLPIGVEYSQKNFKTPQEFITYIQGGLDLHADTSRKYDYGDSANDEEQHFEKGNKLVYAIQSERQGDFVYYYGYNFIGGEADFADITVEIEEEGTTMRILGKRVFLGEWEYVFEVASDIIDYDYNQDGSVTAVLSAEEFRNFPALIALCSTGVGVAAGCTVILISFIIKLRRVKDD